jgi:hypothetical protein
MLKDKIIETLIEHFEAHIKKHAMNVEIMLENPQGIPEHTDFMDSIEKELEHIAEYKDKIEALHTVEDLM